MGRRLELFGAAATLIFFVLPTAALDGGRGGFYGISGDYCRVRRPEQCCISREDECTAPILENHLCYCDQFCDRPESIDGGDCCPDWYDVCSGGTKPIPDEGCVHPHTKIKSNPGETVRINCRTCTCTGAPLHFDCDSNTKCMIEEDIIQKVNLGRSTWRAGNYSKFWGVTVADGNRYRLGTLWPDRSVENMRAIEVLPKELPEEFDARIRWPGMVQPVRDQGDCASSWAFSTTATASDRAAIQSSGKNVVPLSVQQLLSCYQRRDLGCGGGHIDRAWWTIRKLGFGSATDILVPEDCYQYRSGDTNEPGACKVDQNMYRKDPTSVDCPSGDRRRVKRVYRTTPPYRLSNKETDIMTDIMMNGPVQATFLAPRDFYMYKSGVYKTVIRPTEVDWQPLAIEDDTGKQHKIYHSVRIIGWGVDRSNGGVVKYWKQNVPSLSIQLAANSWGKWWGEDGYFRIVRGDNHLDIEKYVLAAWGPGEKLRRRRLRHMRLRRRKLHRLRQL